MFAVQFQPRFTNRTAPWAGFDGHPVDRGQAPAVTEDRDSAQRLCTLCALKGYEGPFVVDVREATPEDLTRWD
jgi:hypothetical protein